MHSSNKSEIIDKWRISIYATRVRERVYRKQGKQGRGKFYFSYYALKDSIHLYTKFHIKEVYIVIMSILRFLSYMYAHVFSLYMRLTLHKAIVFCYMI